MRSRQLEPYPIQANSRLQSSPPGYETAKYDLVPGTDSIVVEVKFDADYPGVSKPVCFADDIAKDLERLQAVRRYRACNCHFVLIDEDGMHRRNLHKHDSASMNWRELKRADNKQGFLLYDHL